MDMFYIHYLFFLLNYCLSVCLSLFLSHNLSLFSFSLSLISFSHLFLSIFPLTLSNSLSLYFHSPSLLTHTLFLLSSLSLSLSFALSQKVCGVIGEHLVTWPSSITVNHLQQNVVFVSIQNKNKKPDVILRNEIVTIFVT